MFFSSIFAPNAGVTEKVKLSMQTCLGKKERIIEEEEEQEQEEEDLY